MSVIITLFRTQHKKAARMHPLHETSDTHLLRLDVLRRLQVLDSPTEERFIRITRMARNMFDVPIALISFEDNEHEWAKPCYGLNIHEPLHNISFVKMDFLKNACLLLRMQPKILFIIIIQWFKGSHTSDSMLVIH